MIKKEKLRVGNRVQVCINSGIDSGKYGTIKNLIRDNEAKVLLDDGNEIAISKNRLIKEGEQWRPAFK